MRRNSALRPHARIWIFWAVVVTAAMLVAPSVSTGQQPRAELLSVAESSTTLGFADSHVYFASDTDVAETVRKWVTTGVRTARIGIPWANIEPVKGTLDWTNADRIVDAAAGAQIQLVADIITTPTWAAVSGAFPPNGRPAEAATYGEFAGRVAARYRGKIAAYEIWNEPNAWQGYSPQPDPAGYTDLLKAAYPAVKAADPSATVVGGALGCVVNWGWFTVNPVSFLASMYSAGAAPFFDALSFHPYSYSVKFSAGVNQTDSPVDQLIRLRKVMLNNGDGEKKIWVTEYGIPTTRVSESDQAAYLSDIIGAWQQLPYAGPLMIYTTRDNSLTGTTDEDHCGVYRADWSAKPAAQVLSAPPGPGPLFQEFMTITDPALGSVLSPVFSASATVWVQLRSSATVWRMAPGQFLTSPAPVGDLARARQVTPLGAFESGYQDFGGGTAVRVWYSEGTGAHWASMGFANAWTPQLGLATTDERWVNGGTQVDFEHGAIKWIPFVGFQTTLT